MQILQCSDLNLIKLILQEPLHYRNQIGLSNLRSEYTRQLMNRVGQSLFNSSIIELCEFEVNFLKLRPVISA
jgi:hypothetical protein